MIGLINYEVGNLGSIKRMLDKLGSDSVIINRPSDFSNLKKIILPGVGHYAEGVRSLKKTGLWEAVLEFSNTKHAFVLGICLGMQLLCKCSEEGDVHGLGIVDATVKKFQFPDSSSLKVPHMGWNITRVVRENPLISSDTGEQRFYYVHSYKVVPNNLDISIGQCHYGGDFCAAFQQGNIFGVQFHPEKSHRFGMALIKRFVEL